MTLKTATPTVLEATQALCTALTQDYKAYAIRQTTNNAQRFSSGNDILGTRPDLSEYAKERLAKLENDEELMQFRIESGRKYFKVIQQENRGGQLRDGSVHAFIDKKNGDVFKPASSKSPAKHVRYNLLDENSRNLCLNRANWAGGYLYLR